jgi:hypothetical protein
VARAEEGKGKNQFIFLKKKLSRISQRSFALVVVVDETKKDNSDAHKGSNQPSKVA